MSFEWDEDKRERNLTKHGVDFRRAAQVFEGPVSEEVDTRQTYGELRIRCFGHIEGRLYILVYTFRGPNRRIISARKANGREQRAYYARHTR